MENEKHTSQVMSITKAKRLKGRLTVPGDKSISHRAVMLGSLAQGTTEIRNFLESADCLSTLSCFLKMGIMVTRDGNCVLIKGLGLHGLKCPAVPLDVGNSGTTMRLLSGILAAQNFNTTLTGDASIRKRPMDRIIKPLSSMGASITSVEKNGCAPLMIQGRPLRGCHCQTPVASAQVKSACLLAGLYAEGETTITEPCLSRNHTELMLGYFGIPVASNGTSCTVKKAEKLTGRQITIPGDISSAAYFIAAGLLVPHSEILIENVGINPTRDGMLRVCKKMGASITLENQRTISGEPVADILIRSSSLRGTQIQGDLIPALIDELPILAVMACFAKGRTVIKDAAELKVKESNRITVMAENLSAMGASIIPTEDGMIIEGTGGLHGAVIPCHEDHRIAMSFGIAGLCAEGETTLMGSQCVSISYPDFFHDLKNLMV